MNIGQWIWLDESAFPDCVHCGRSIWSEDKSYALAELFREYSFDKEMRLVSVRLFADTRYTLYANGELVAFGPSCYGGDYGDDGKADYPAHWSDFDFAVSGSTLSLRALVQLGPRQGWDFSKGRGGFCLGGEVSFADGSSVSIVSDETWRGRKTECALAETEFDFTRPEKPFAACVPIKDIWHPQAPVLPNLAREAVYPIREVRDGARRRYEWERIYCGSICFSVSGASDITVRYHTEEIEGRHNDKLAHTIRANEPFTFRSMVFHSAAYVEFELSDPNAELSDVHIDFIHYPTPEEGHFDCSDPLLNSLYDTVRHTLKMCRQSIHLDSPTHKEPLGCTGDYAVEAELTYFMFGDARLIRSDCVHTADLIRLHDGKMFHTSYSLIWPEMMLEYYRFTGDVSLIAETADALDILLRRFYGYCDADSVIVNPPNYMFLDWGEVGGYTLHHPPKALGQTGLNCFWYGALKSAAELWTLIGNTIQAEECTRRAESLRAHFDERFFDAERGLYIAGTPGSEKSNEPRWLPDNSDRCWFIPQANVLPVAYGLCRPENARGVLDFAINGGAQPELQPYFYAYLMRAVDAAGLFDEWGIKLMHNYARCLDVTDKGLAEGWGAFKGDYSHAWGGAPAAWLVRKALGFEMVKPGFEEYRTQPNALGLSYIDVAMPSPNGMICAHIERSQSVSQAEQSASSTSFCGNSRKKPDGSVALS